MINFDAIFFSQGVIDMCYWKPMVKARRELADTVLAPLGMGMFIFLYACTSPMNYTSMGHLFFYPLYTDYPLQIFHTTGTWIWVYLIVWLMAECCNDEFNRIVYNFVTGVSLYAYLSHYFFIVVIVVVLIRPYKIGFIPAFFIVFFGTLLLIAATYIPLNFLYELIFPPKETKKL